MAEFNNILKLIISELQTELIGQGHDATGSLVNSLTGSVLTLPNSIVIEVLMNDYGIYVNEGRRPGTKKVPLQVLMDWVERRAIASGNKEVKSIAFAIQQVIFKEGSPTDGSSRKGTKGSFAFTPNGRRKGFIDFVIENKLDPILSVLSDEVFQDFDTLVSNITKDFNKKNK